MGTTHHMAKGDREAACERGRVRDAHEPEPSGCRPLESGLRSEDSGAVRRGAVGKVPARATRWRPTLPHAGFWSRGGQSDLSIDCNQQRPVYEINQQAKAE